MLLLGTLEETNCDYRANTLIKEMTAHLFVFMGQFLRVCLQRRHVLVLCQVKHLNGAGVRRADFLLLVLFLICAVFSTLQGMKERL